MATRREEFEDQQAVFEAQAKEWVRRGISPIGVWEQGGAYFFKSPLHPPNVGDYIFVQAHPQPEKEMT